MAETPLLDDAINEEELAPEAPLVVVAGLELEDDELERDDERPSLPLPLPTALLLEAGVAPADVLVPETSRRMTVSSKSVDSES